MATSYEARIAGYLAAHPGATRQEARGHRQGPGGTPEHGRIAAPVAVAGREVFTTRSAYQAERLIARAAANGQRVSVAVTDSKNPTRPISVWTNERGGRTANGISATYVRDDMRAKGVNAKRYLEGTRFSRRTKAGKTVGYRPKGIKTIQVTVY